MTDVDLEADVEYKTYVHLKNLKADVDLGADVDLKAVVDVEADVDSEANTVLHHFVFQPSPVLLRLLSLSIHWAILRQLPD